MEVGRKVNPLVSPGCQSHHGGLDEVKMSKPSHDSSMGVGTCRFCSVTGSSGATARMPSIPCPFLHQSGKTVPIHPVPIPPREEQKGR